MMSSNDFEEVLDSINDFTGMTDEEVMYDDDLSLRPPIPPPNSVPQQPLVVYPEIVNGTSDENEYIEDYDVSTLLNSFFAFSFGSHNNLSCDPPKAKHRATPMAPIASSRSAS